MMTPGELLPHELMQIFADFFEEHQINYRVVGSIASMVYGEPRFTNDIDIVVDLPMSKVSDLFAAFTGPEYYFSEQAARDAILHKFQFNIIHPASGLKVDFFLPPDTDFARLEMGRGKRITSDGEYSVWFGSPEGVILNKLTYYQLGGSEKHLRDITGMLKLLRENLDYSYINAWAIKLGVNEEWQMILQRFK